MRVRESLKEPIRKFLHLLYPPHCYICENPLPPGNRLKGRYLCSDCFKKIEKVEGPFCICGTTLETNDPLIDLCKACANRKIYFDLARSYGYYDYPLIELIKAFKNRGEKDLSVDLSWLLKEVVKDLPYPFSVITYIPMTKIRIRKRGFNQGKLLAEELANRLKVEVVPALVKVTRNLPQKGLSRKERAKNVKDVFECALKDMSDNILLVDDVFTSGATVNEACRVLKEAGYKKVLAITVARAKLK